MQIVSYSFFYGIIKLKVKGKKMTKDLNDFINNKTKIDYDFHKENTVYDDLYSQYEMSYYFKRILSNTTDRDFFVAKNENKVVGIAILFKKYQARNNPNEGVVSLTNIEVDPDFKNEGIGTQLLNNVADYCLEHNYILRRTSPTEEGQSFIFNKFGKMLDKKGLSWIPENLGFIYDDLEKNVFDNKTYSAKDKIRLMKDVAQQVCDTDIAKEYDLNIEKLSSNFLMESREIINTFNSKKSKTKRLKI